ncbi:polysaccharide biosynthesis tyrosine autokinase [Jeotgalibacillus sp. S-D1]|uniref:CpsD/CapB family tyrosine-protein kinase n=1 Tax=Jeotgalibacillus sp. S-D1 TaxID=2552189 RepID=UPI001059A7A9|nr:CpsD/CapB family tyrosine-protein kinase [Jeotgalibacillus sp. S-D1]TDL32622.1 polysaccharide biosynthesis tyrosine autokinase [Jeotgalibacillus sp. S-D1]
MAGKKNKNSEIKKRNLIAEVNPRSVASEQYRTIRTNIQFSAIEDDIRTVVVTSSSPGEGKSTTAANLAIVFAQQGKRVLLVDADMRKPTVHFTFNIMNTLGLTNVLTRQSELDGAVTKTEIERLDILPSGPIPPNPSELLSSRGMTSFITAAKSVYDLIVFDSPPVLAVTDAQVLSHQCDGSILVVRSRIADKEKAVKAKELMLSAKARILGVILNDKKMKSNDEYYYYGNG